MKLAYIVKKDTVLYENAKLKICKGFYKCHLSLSSQAIRGPILVSYLNEAAE